jgi:hypothetical protein
MVFSPGDGIFLITQQLTPLSPLFQERGNLLRDRFKGDATQTIHSSPLKRKMRNRALLYLFLYTLIASSLLTSAEGSPATDSILRESVEEIKRSCRKEPSTGVIPFGVGIGLTGSGIAAFAMGFYIQKDAKEMEGDGQPVQAVFYLTGSLMEVIGAALGISGLPFIGVGFYQSRKYREWKEYCTGISMQFELKKESVF